MSSRLSPASSAPFPKSQTGLDTQMRRAPFFVTQTSLRSSATVFPQNGDAPLFRSAQNHPPISAYFFLTRASFRIHGPYKITRNTAVDMACMVSKGSAAAYTTRACPMDCGW